MLSQQLLTDQEAHTIMSAASSFQKSFLISEKIKPVSFCELLRKFNCQSHIADALLNGKLYTYT